MAGKDTSLVGRVMSSVTVAATLLGGTVMLAPTPAQADTPGRLIAGSCVEDLQADPPTVAGALYDVPLEGGAVTPLGDVTANDNPVCLLGLGYDPATDTLFGLGGQLLDQAVSHSLLDIPLTAGSADVIGPVDLGADSTLCGLEWNDAGQNLWTLGSTSDVALSLYRIDPQTVAPTPVGALSSDPPGVLCSLAYVPETGLLYGLENVNHRLVSIDPDTGEVTTVGTTGIGFGCSLAYDTDDGVMYAGSYPGIDPRSANGNAHLYTVDLQTGVATDLGDTGVPSLCGMAYIPAVVEPTTTTTAPATTTTAAAPLAAVATPRFTG